MSEKFKIAMAAYLLGRDACELVIRKPRGWRPKLLANMRAAAKMGIHIAPDAFQPLEDLSKEGKLK